MGRRRVNQDISNKIIELHLTGMSSRKICAEFGWSKSKKSTVNNVIGRFKRGELEYPADVVKTYDGNTVGQPLQDHDIDNEILEALCKHPDWTVSSMAKKVRTYQRSNNLLRKIQREAFDSEGDKDFESIIVDAVKKIGDVKVPKYDFSKRKKNKRTVEILFSDLQIGKISEHYNTEIAIRALKYYGEEVIRKVMQVNPERIVFTALGDNCEDNMKHGVQSAISTDTSNAEQLSNCISEVWGSVLLPLFSLGIPVDFYGVQGNHLSSTVKGMGNFYEGRQGWDYAIYSTWKLLAETMNFDHVTFTIPEGIFGTYEIYGKTTVYEHGYELKGQGESAMQKLKEKRMNNTKKFIDRIVIGDRHHSEIYGCGDYVLNGAFFGLGHSGVEYSGNLGFNSNPMQTILVHEPTDLPNVSTVVGIHCVQIVKGYGI